MGRDRSLRLLDDGLGRAVRTYHAKAMPVILTQEAEWDLWTSGAPWDEVRHLQRPLPEGALKVVATGSRQDDVLPALA